MSYQIPAQTRLIILDAHDTLLKRDLSRDPKNPLQNAEEKEKVQWQVRNGFLNFLDYFGQIKGIKLCISSDGGKQYLTEVCHRFGIERQFAAIYGREHLDPETYLKRVDKILEDLKIPPNQAVFIGDSPIDERSAGLAGVPFISVPDSLKEPDFSFNAFIPLEFNQNNFGLEIQKITNPKAIYHNLNTAQLVEEVIRHQEGTLQHLGRLQRTPTPTRLRNPEDTEIGHYLVGIPYEEQESFPGAMPNLAVEDFQIIHQRMLAFLQDREIFLQDCFLGAGSHGRIPVRIITQHAWASLWARHMLIQAKPEEMEGFFPEFTLIFLPNFLAVPEFDNIAKERFVIINQLTKQALLGGVQDSGEIKECLFRILSYHLPKSDHLPLRAGALLHPTGESLLLLAPSDETRFELANRLQQPLLGMDLLAWKPEGLANLEWGVSIQGTEHLTRLKTQFAALQEETRISFPMTHLPEVSRAGHSAIPKRVLLVLPLALEQPRQIPPSLAALFWFLGLSQTPTGELTSRPLFSPGPYLKNPLHIALGLWEKLQHSGAEILAVSLGHLDNPKLLASLQTFAAQEVLSMVPWQDPPALLDQALPLLQPWVKQLPREFVKALPENWGKGIANLK